MGKEEATKEADELTAEGEASREKEEERKMKVGQVGGVKIDEVEALNEVLAKSTYKILQEELVRLLKEDLKVFSRDYPDLINKRFFYIRPHERFFAAWVSKWAEILLAYCSNENRFIVSLDELVSTPPFRSDKTGLALSLEDLRIIIDRLVEDGKARWLDREKKVAIIYWVPLEYLADRIVELSREIEFKYVTVQLLDKVFPDLILEEKIALLNLIVTKNKGVWVKENYAIKLEW